MPSVLEAHRTGLQALAEVTVLLQRVRSAHPTAGLHEAADMQWSWRIPRPTDDLPQLFWVDHLGRPDAAVIVTDVPGRTELAPIVMPDADPDWLAHVVERGLAHARTLGRGALSLEVDAADDALREVLVGHGFAVEGEGVVETWMATDARPEVSAPPEGYRLSRRVDTVGRPHHMISPERNHPDVEDRLRQTSLYRPDLDLVVHDRHEGVAAYGLFWYDPVTATGLVEPMRTEADHRRRGLARHILTTGIDRLAAAGAERIKICFEPGNPASRGLYLDVGFVPHRRTVVVARGTGGAGR
ncbi:GNAT family N-acetyltransferase [Iamia sp. SCSIO 61187]|uniref:GNAT family N-acetyltransferase n=1 Tax=Iamia sp. SCSIO 61187 TaxID=2722752 RepID=UPI001C63A738|nr:GNAT family N-acetyltransferase [Iamia sp. SCSIO 61187]QYG92139.1 GNAT family N-acetyltransferase [Iamia sp. SCSIO 61187]